MGGAILLFVISSLCIVVLYVRKFHDKKKVNSSDDNRIEIEMNSDIKMNNNPSYSSIKQNGRQEDEYDYQYALHNIFSLQDDEESTIKMNSNPSYERIHGHNTVNYNTTTPAGLDAAFHPNPSYSSIAKENIKASEDEDEDGYVETNSHIAQRVDYLKIIAMTTNHNEEKSIYDNDTDDTGKVEINPDPLGVNLEDNPSYNKIILGQYP